MLSKFSCTLLLCAALLVWPPRSLASHDAVSGSFHRLLFVSKDGQAALMAVCDAEDGSAERLDVLGAAKDWAVVGSYKVKGEPDWAVAACDVHGDPLTWSELRASAPRKLRKLLKTYKTSAKPKTRARSPTGGAYALVAQGRRRAEALVVDGSGVVAQKSWDVAGRPDGAGRLWFAWDPKGRYLVLHGSLVLEKKGREHMVTPITQVWMLRSKPGTAPDIGPVADHLMTFARKQHAHCKTTKSAPAGAHRDFWCGLSKKAVQRALKLAPKREDVVFGAAELAAKPRKAMTLLKKLARLKTPRSKELLSKAASNPAFEQLRDNAAFKKLTTP